VITLCPRAPKATFDMLRCRALDDDVEVLHIIKPAATPRLLREQFSAPRRR
jgi:hypothetical protein